LLVTIKGGDKHQDVEMKELDLTRGMQNAGVENKIIELDNENNWLKRGIALWQVRADNLEELIRTLGMFYLAYNILEQNEMLTKDTANNLKGRFAQALQHCFHDNKIEYAYCDNLPPFPDSIDEQKSWINSQCSRLRYLIDEQRQGLSDYVQNVGSIPSS